MQRRYRRYDPRLKNLVATSKDIGRFERLGIPSSTLRDWQRKGPQDFFTLPEFELSSVDLVEESLSIKAKLNSVLAEQELVIKTIRIFGFQIQYKRLPSASAKADIIGAIKHAASVLPLQACLAAIGLNAARYHHWLKRQVSCLLEDRASCPRVSPSQLTGTEVNAIKKLYTSAEFAHFSMASLSWLAKKTGEVVASASTWSRVIRDLELKRNRVRVYPPKSKVGVRASAPGQLWHLDLTILRLQDGTRAFVQAVIDNFSRYVLAWKVAKDYGGLRTKELLLQAIAKATDLGLSVVPNVYVDSGSENLNEHVDGLVGSKLIARTVAQIDVEYSNSMIEMLFLRLKHRYLFTIPLTNFEALERRVDFYLTESNDIIPHSALKGATPKEAITGMWGDEKIAAMQALAVTARIERIQSNQSARCTPCLA